MLGQIGNDDVLAAAVTLASFALFLPASREGGAVWFRSRQGRLAFGLTLSLLVGTAVTAALHTLAAFVLLIVALLAALTLGAWSLAWRDETATGLMEAAQALRRRRPAARRPGR
jgi:hypothetical protein